MQPESRQTTKLGVPIRSASASTWAGRSGDPDSSLASISTTQRAWAPAAGAHGLDRGEAGERRVAVVGATPAVEAITFEHRRPRAEPVAPAVHLRLLVEMAVEDHGVVRRRVAEGRHLDDDHRRAARELVHLDRRTLDRT